MRDFKKSEIENQQLARGMFFLLKNGFYKTYNNNTETYAVHIIRLLVNSQTIDANSSSLVNLQHHMPQLHLQLP